MEWYLLNVGKPTPTKLANFPEIEVFIFIGCPEGAFLDSKDYMKPVLTLAELELALDSNLYFTDIGPIHDFKVALSRPVISKQQDLDDDGESCDNITNALSKLNSYRDLITYDITSSNSASFLKSRSWKGVEEEPGESNEPHASKEGRYGIPSGYSHEGSLQLDRPI
jgi:diphthamide biosynthesis protein 2